jgi:N-acetylneuraminic acid mutarotase
LSFADRVAYQRAIEDVYWRHRIWPKERPDPKPSLDAVMSQAQLERKVEEYLRNSQALEDYWQRPITAAQLQADTERMASHTKQPEVLHEIFEALGNDPFVIAECLARPVLAERFANGDPVAAEPALNASRTGVSPAPAVVVTPLRGVAQNVPQGGRYSERQEVQVPVTMAAISSANYTLPVISSPSGACTDDTWTATSIASAPDGRFYHTAVWTGTEMIVWGGTDNSSFFNTGGRYNPSTDSWTATGTTNAPPARVGHTAVWTGTEMIVWGGADSSGYLNPGGRYNPSTDSWTATSTTNAPDGRASHTAVWTGSEMIVWGGSFCEAINCNYLNTGGRYNPSTDSWTATSTTNAPDGRASHTGVWTGSEMIVWGGDNFHPLLLNTGGRYNPSTDSWIATSTTNAPDGRLLHTAVWTGSEMIVWGGANRSPPPFNTGGRYNPSTDSWAATSTTNAPGARAGHTAVWTGSQMIVWGGVDNTSNFNTGGRYNPGTDSWTVTSTTSAPDGRFYHTAVWTGSEMIVWGGQGNSGHLNTGGRYCAAAPSPTPTPTPRIAPTPRARPTPAPRP